MQGIIEAVFSLETASVESNVPVGGVVNELEESRDDGIQSVSLKTC